MIDWIQIKESSAEYTNHLDLSDLQSDIQNFLSEEQIRLFRSWKIKQSDELGLYFQAEGLLLDVRYRWKIRPKPEQGSYVVEEKQFRHAATMILFALSMLTLSAGALMLTPVLPTPSIMVELQNLILIISAGICLYVFTPPRDVNRALLNENTDYTKSKFPLTSYGLAGIIGAALVAGYLLTKSPIFWIILTLLTVATNLFLLLYIFDQKTYLKFVEPVLRNHLWEQKSLAKGYSIFLILLAMPPTVGLSIIYVFPDLFAGLTQSDFTSNMIWVQYLWAAVILHLSYRYLTETFPESTFWAESLIEENSHNLSRYTQIISITAVTLIAYSGIYLYYLYIQTIPGLILPEVLVGLPLLFLFAGLCYQEYHLLKTAYTVLTKTTRYNQPITEKFDSTVLLLDSDSPTAFAFTTFRTDYIILSKELENLLTPLELEAVLAHEEAHNHRKDTIIGQLAILLSPLVLTGSNVLLDLLNFRDRELKADKKAAEQAGVDPLISAIEKINGANMHPETQDFGGFDTFSKQETRGHPSKYFNGIFGSYAMAEVHPDKESREENVSED